MLQLFLKLSNILVTVGHVLDTVTLGLAIFEVTFVSALIGPSHLTLSMNLIVYKFALVGFTGINEIVFAFTMELSIDEITFINITVLLVTCPASFLSFHKCAFVDALSIIPSFNTLSMLLVHFPLAFVDGFVCLVDKDAVTVRLTVDPVALINVAVCIGHSSFANHLFVFDLAGIHGTILVFDVTKALPFGFVFLLELSFIFSLVIDFGPIVIPNQILSFILFVQILDPFLMGQKSFFVLILLS